MMDVIPTTQWVGNRVRFDLATITMTIGIVWLAHRVFSMISVATDHGNPLTTTYFFAFMLLWWVALAWMVTCQQAASRSPGGGWANGTEGAKVRDLRADTPVDQTTEDRGETGGRER